MFKEILLGKLNPLNQVYDPPESCDMEVEEVQNNDPKSTVLTKEELERIHAPWKAAVIIKVFGKKKFLMFTFGTNYQICGNSSNHSS